jgi:hypothetical protein
MLPTAATAVTPHHKHLVALIVFGLFFLVTGAGYWTSGKLRERRNAIPKYFGLAKYWWVLLTLSGACLFAALIDAAI